MKIKTRRFVIVLNNVLISVLLISFQIFRYKYIGIQDNMVFFSVVLLIAISIPILINIYLLNNKQKIINDKIIYDKIFKYIDIFMIMYIIMYLSVILIYTYSRVLLIINIFLIMVLSLCIFLTCNKIYLIYSKLNDIKKEDNIINYLELANLLAVLNSIFLCMPVFLIDISDKIVYKLLIVIISYIFMCFLCISKCILLKKSTENIPPKMILISIISHILSFVTFMILLFFDLFGIFTLILIVIPLYPVFKHNNIVSKEYSKSRQDKT